MTAGVSVRQVQSGEELELAFDIAGSVFVPPIDHHDRRFERVAVAWPDDRDLMYVAERRYGDPAARQAKLADLRARRAARSS